MTHNDPKGTKPYAAMTIHVAMTVLRPRPLKKKRDMGRLPLAVPGNSTQILGQNQRKLGMWQESPALTGRFEFRYPLRMIIQYLVGGFNPSENISQMG